MHIHFVCSANIYSVPDCYYYAFVSYIGWKRIRLNHLWFPVRAYLFKAEINTNPFDTTTQFQLNIFFFNTFKHQSSQFNKHMSWCLLCLIYKYNMVSHLNRKFDKHVFLVWYFHIVETYQITKIESNIIRLSIDFMSNSSFKLNIIS